MNLTPAEQLALTVGRAQVERGDEPMPNIAAVCIIALARLVDESPSPVSEHRIDWLHDRDTIVQQVTCSAPEAASCRSECAERCGDWEDGHGCDHDRSPVGICIVKETLDDCAVGECYGGPPNSPLRSGPIVPYWSTRDESILWRYADDPEEQL